MYDSNFITYFVFSFSKNPYTVAQWQESFQCSYSGLVGTLPDNVHLLTVERIGTSEVLLRLENFYEIAEMNKTASVNLNGLFKDFEVLSVVEMNLSANQLIKDKARWQWDTMEGRFHSEESRKLRDMIVDLKPMEIRTFVATIKSTTSSDVSMDFHEILDEMHVPLVL